MPEEFEGDLSESVFWGVDLQRAMFRDADLSGATFFHTRWNGVSIDGVIDRLVINGVDVTEHVNANDRWFPLRTRLEPTDQAELESVWTDLRSQWAVLFDRVDQLDPSIAVQSVNGEWSLRDTLRHLVFAIDKWFSWPILGERSFTANGLPNTGSQAREWPGLRLSNDPDMAIVRAEYVRAADRVSDYVAQLDLSTLPDTVEVVENGSVPPLMCFHVVLEENFEHLRYAVRDLESLTATDLLAD